MKLLKKIVGIVAATALGSAFWDFFLKDFFLFVSRIFIEILSRFSINYIDRLYYKLSEAEVSLIIAPEFYGCIIITGFYLFLFMLSSRINAKTVNNFREENGLRTRPRKSISYARYMQTKIVFKRYTVFHIMVAFLTLVVFVIFYESLVVTTFKYSNKVTMERNIEIVRPYITNDQFLIFRSHFYLIDTKEEFIRLKENIDSVAMDRKINLPKFKTAL